MRTTYYLTLILSFTLLFASCKKDEDAAENTPPTPTEQEYTVDLYLKYTGNYSGAIVKYNDQNGVEQQETLDLNQTKWKKTIIVKKGFKIFVRGELNLEPGPQHAFEAGTTIHKKDGDFVFSGSQPQSKTGLQIAIPLSTEYTKTL